MRIFIKVEPFDTLFFRTARPFVMGEDAWADGVFPPFPSTLYGAVRSFLIFRMGKLSDFYSGKLDSLGGDVIGKVCKDKEGNIKRVEKGKLKLEGPILYKDEIEKTELGSCGPVFRIPYDMVKKEDSKVRLQRLELVDKPTFLLSDWNLEKVLFWKSVGMVKSCNGWLRLIDFESYLQGSDGPFEFEKNELYFIDEPKVGIARNKETFTSEEGKLYRIPMTRLRRDTSLVIGVYGIDNFDTEGVLQLGGEGRAVRFERIEDPLRELRDIKFELKNGFFKLYFATPSIFGKGWLPEWINGDTMEGELGGVKLKLVACAIGKPIPVGGWDIAKSRPKPLRRAVPSGSVYYFRVLNDATPEEIKRTFHMRNLSDVGSEEGFGFAFVGEV